MVEETTKRWKVGQEVTVPWGLKTSVTGRIVEVWGDPPAHVRVELDLDVEPGEEPVVLLLPANLPTAA